MKKWVFPKSGLIQCKNAYKRKVLMKMSYQEDPIAVIFVVVVWRGEAYEVDFYKKSSIPRKLVIVPVPDRGILKSSRALPETTWTRISRSRRWDTSRSPKSSQKIEIPRKSVISAYILFGVTAGVIKTMNLREFGLTHIILTTSACRGGSEA